MINQIQSNYGKAQAANSLNNSMNVERIRVPRRANTMDSVSFSGRFTATVQKKAGNIFEAVRTNFGKLIHSKFAQTIKKGALNAKDAVLGFAKRAIENIKKVPKFIGEKISKISHKKA